MDWEREVAVWVEYAELDVRNLDRIKDVGVPTIVVLVC